MNAVGVTAKLRRVIDHIDAHLKDDISIAALAEVDGHVVGNIYMTFIEHPLRAHICELSDLVVNPGFQRMGIARRLLEECKTLAVNAGRTKSVVSPDYALPA